MTSPDLPETIRPGIEDYLAQVESRLPGLLYGFYVVGSLALESFDEKFSDVDFVALLTRLPAPVELETLREIHRRVEKAIPRWKLSGSYLLVEDLGRHENQIPLRPYYHDSRLHPAGRFELNPITWWVLKNHAIPLRGPAPQELPFEVDWAGLVAWTRQNMNTYWISWTRRLDGFLVLLTDWGIQWTVLGVLRQFYTLRENRVTTKVKAGEYALTCLPERWHRLVQEALNIRLGQKGSAYRWRVSRASEATRFLRYIIRLCNTERRQ
jgi:hypothetical protein